MSAPVLFQQVGAVHELLVAGGDLRGLRHVRVKSSFQAGRYGQPHRSGEHDGVTRLHPGLEMSGNIEILLAGESAAVFIGIGHALVPARGRHEGNLLRVELHVQVREALVKVEGHSARNLPSFRTRVGVLVGQGVDVPERKERSEQQLHLPRSVDQLETDHDLVGIRDEKDALGENYLTHPVGDFRHRVSLEIDDVLVTARLIDTPVAMDAKVELLPVKDEALIQRGQKQVLLASESINRHSQQTVVAPCVASHYGSVAVGSGLVGTDDLPLQ